MAKYIYGPNILGNYCTWKQRKRCSSLAQCFMLAKNGPSKLKFETCKAYKIVPVKRKKHGKQ